MLGLQVSQEEYNNFFKTTFREFLDPLAQTHFSVEGTIEFSALMFIPGMAPFEQQVRLSLSLSFPCTMPLLRPVSASGWPPCLFCG